jgi:lipase chaperone LimK
VNMMTLSLPRKNTIITLLVLMTLVVVGLKLFIFDQDKLIQIINSNTISIPENNNINGVVKNTIASEWQWVEKKTSQVIQPNSSDTAKNVNIFTEESVYNALSQVRLDNNGNIIIDNETLTALNNTLDDDRLQLDSEALLKLQILIKKGLPGNTGEEVANIVGNYYGYLGAEREFNTVYEEKSTTNLDVNESIEQQKRNYQELSSLRELYLDTDVATQLFSAYDANANYMFEVLKIDNDNSLSEEEKNKLSSDIALKHSDESINVDNWSKRYKTFLTAKENITTASMNDNEKKIQLTELMHQHFSHEELVHVSHFQLDEI